MSGYTFEESNGAKKWRLNDEFHREDGPAVEYSDGSRLWYIKGKLHREDGPAAEYEDCYKAWWVNDRLLSKEEFIKKAKNKKFITAEIESLKSYGIEVG
jgi:hypothetical protein